MYNIVFHKRVKKQLKKLPRIDQTKIAKAVKKLQQNPLNPLLNIKPYQKTKRTWRIRTGKLRTIYRFDSKKKTIYIEYIGYRGDVYKKT